MKIKGLSKIFLILIFLVTPGFLFAGINWNHDFRQALARAGNQGKNIFLYIFTPKARDCKRFESETFVSPEVISLLNNTYIPLRIDATRDTTIGYRYGIFKAPTILILDSTGNEFKRLITFYTPQKLVSSLSQVVAYKPRQGGPSGAGAAPPAPQTVFYQPFDNLFGWANESSTEGSMGQISLVQGVKGSAFRIDYELVMGEWSYIQLHRRLSSQERFQLPDEFTMIFHIAGNGGANALNVKLADDDGTNFGGILPIPTDNKPHRIVLTSRDIKYLWGGNDQKLDGVSVFLLAITPGEGNKNSMDPREKMGTLYIDEIVILPGIQQ